MTAPLAVPLWRNLAVALGYVASGLVVAQLPSPVAGLPAIAPGVGIALVALLAGGWRLLPGVVLGAVALAALHYGSPATPDELVSVSGTFCVVAAVAAQAVLAAWLARRWPRNPVAADQPWNEFLLLLLGALTGLIDAVVRTGLIVNGHASVDVAFVLLVAWIGNAAGVLLAVPLTLAIFFHRDALWRRRLWTTVLPSMLTLVGVLAVFNVLDAHEKRRINDAFVHEAAEIDGELQRHILVYQRVVLYIERFWRSSEHVSRDEFRRFSKPVLAEFPALKALEWIPVVPQGQRARFEQAGRADGLRDFTIRERDADGKLVPAGPRAQYLPVFYVEPLAGNDNVFGFDIASVADRRAFLEAARQRNAPTGSAPITLIQDSQPGNGLLIIMPVHDRHGTSGETAPDAPLLGYAVSVFHIDALLADIEQRARRAHMTFSVTDATDAQALAVYRMTNHRAHAGTLQFEQDLDFGGRVWRTRYVATPGYTANAHSIEPWLALGGGGVLVGLLQALLLGLSGQASRTRNEVERRTHELRMLVVLNEELQASRNSEQAQAAIARLLPQLFPGTRGSLAMTTESSAEIRDIVQWGGAPTGSNRIEMPLRNRDRQFGSLWIEPEQDDGQSLSQDVQAVAQAIQLAMTSIRLREALRDQAIRDALTGLYNRRYLAEIFAHELARAQRSGLPFCVALLDIDHFKRVNDTYGHDAGDRVLQELAQHMRNSLRETDGCFRLGGEEFAILLPETDLESGRIRIDKLRAEFALRVFRFEEHPEYRPTFSAGIVEAPHAGDRLDELLQLADAALYRAKESGRNRVLASPSINEDPP